MLKVNCSAEFSKFHKEDVTLQQSEQTDMRSRRNAGRTRLTTGLEKDGHPLPKETVSQGSYAMRTMVQDPECDYDIDDGAYFNQEDLKDKYGTALTPYLARERVCNALKHDERLKHTAEIHNNCVRQNYPEGYHIDIPVYRLIVSKDDQGNETVEYELASGDKWTKSDARGVTSWFNGIVGTLNSGESDGSQMRRITKLTKKFARSRKEWKAKTTSGITITKLVVDHFVPKTDRDDISLHETWKAISEKLSFSFLVKHPVLEGVNLAEEYDQKVGFLDLCLSDALDDLKNVEEDNCSKKEALNSWDKVFNTTAFSDQFVEESKNSRNASSSPLLRPAALATGGLTFPDKPIVPNKPAGFA